MRTQEEIQKAHDCLIGILLGDVPGGVQFEPQSRKLLEAAVSVLCWVLENEHNQNFGIFLKDIQQVYEQAGFVLERVQK